MRNPAPAILSRFAVLRRDVLQLVLIVILGVAAAAQSPYAKWKNGPSPSPNHFPIGVWLQSPHLAKRYKALGINTYVGLWQGPTETHLKDLRAAGMDVVAAQNTVALKSTNRTAMKAWSQKDEPDNAQPKSGGGYGPPIPPSTIIANYAAMRKADATRPVFLNFGQGVSFEGWKGRGTRTGKLQDYPEYMKGADIVSFDIYPVTHDHPTVKGKLEYVARGVERLVGWAKGQKVVWNFIETTHVKSKVMPTPADVKAEVWMSIVHGSMGILYFVHEWHPKFSSAALLSYPKMMAAVKDINAEIRALAPVLNSTTIAGGATVSSSNSAVPVAHMVKRRGGATYVFAVGMRRAATRATFQVKGLPRDAVATVIGEDRDLTVTAGRFQDDFDPYGVRLYRILPKTLEGSPRKLPISGGKQMLSLSAGTARAYHGYLLLASLSGTVPGIDAGSVHVPLNWDPLTEMSLTRPDLLITNSWGLLNGQGRAAAELRLPPLPATWLGTRLQIAYVTSSGRRVDTASNPVELALVR